MFSKPLSSYESGRAPPALTPEALNLWLLRFRSYLASKGVLYVLDRMPTAPEVDQNRVNTLRRQRKEEELEEYTSTVEKQRSDWERDNAIVYNDLVTSCAADYDANTIILQHPNVTSAVLFKHIQARFDITGQLGTLQSKHAAFNAMLLDSSTKEKASRFIGRIARAGLELIHSGSGDLIKLDVHGVSRLKEGLLHARDTRQFVTFSVVILT